jgi:hypothetical protein
VHQQDSVSLLSLSANRVGILTTALAGYVKEGSLTSSWVHEHDNIIGLSLG